MKTKFIYTASLLVITAVLLSPVLRTANAQSGAATPEALGNKVLEAIKTRNKDALKSLVHPEVVAYIEKNEPGRLNEIINDFVNTQLRPNPEFIIQPMEEIAEYDEATQTLTFRDHNYYFPVAPLDMMVMVADDEVTAKDKDGNEKKVIAKTPMNINMITEYKENWYIVLPVKKTDEQQEENKQ